MTAALATRVEVIKLARLLGVEPDALSYLSEASADDVRRLRGQVTDALFDGDQARLGGFAAASRVTPAPLAATVAQRALGPVLCARLSGLVEPDKAVEIAKRLPAPFLAEVAVDIDPRRAKDVIARVPTALVASVAGELGRRDEAVTMGRFVAFLDKPALRAAMDAMDDVMLLETAFVMDGKERLERLLTLLPPDRVPQLVVAANEKGMWPETLDLLAHLSAKRRAALVELAFDAGVDQILPGLIAAVDETDSWETGLQMLAELPPGLKERLAPTARTLDKAARKRVLARAREHGLLDGLGPIGQALKG